MIRPETESGSAGVAENEGASGQEEPQIPQAPAFSGDVLPCVEAAVTTISGCSEQELKNFCASADYVARQITLHLANRWKQICRTARIQQDDGKSPTVKLSTNIAINLENMLLMDVKVKTGFALKHVETSETQADLRQVEFSISGQADGQLPLDGEEDEDDDKS